MNSESKLRQAVLEALRRKERGLSISELEDALRDQNVEFRRDELRSVVWRLAAAHVVRITADSQIVIEEKGTPVG